MSLMFRLKRSASKFGFLNGN